MINWLQKKEPDHHVLYLSVNVTMSIEVKQRKKGPRELKNTPGSSQTSGHQLQNELQGKVKAGSPMGGHKLLCPDPRTLLCLLCLAICLALSWLVFQQSQNSAVMEEKYLILLKKSEVVEDIEGQVKAMFGKLEYTDKVVKNLGDLQIMKQMEQLKIDITNIEKWSSLISSKRKQLEGNVTNLQEAVAQIEFSTAAIAKEVSMKIKAVQTDVRRISGLEPYVQVLTESVQELEEKLAKVERKTVESIGGMLAGSIDRISSLKSSVSRNSNHIDLIKEKLFQLRGNLSENSEQLLNLESDRLKVMKAVNFANDLKPKVFTLRKDFQNLDNMINELSLRIGRLASDLLSREEDITLLNDKLYNLTLIKSAILDLNDKISHL
eukprot:XP_017947656.1 PREDICTED: inhibitor of nuclear factor kappa-B kinase-interacting protein isoform X3 [Xenopus tropicalis]